MIYGLVAAGGGSRWTNRYRHRGLGRALAMAARHLVPDGASVWSQQAAGNARSVRAFQTTGFRPVDAEALLFAT